MLNIYNNANYAATIFCNISSIDLDKVLPFISMMPTNLWLVQLSTEQRQIVRRFKAAFFKVCSRRH